jgi:TonB family protein
MNEFERLERRHLGALGIQRCVGPNLMRGLVVSVLFHSALISLPVVARWLAPAVVSSGPTGPILVLPPIAPQTPWTPPGDLRPTPPKRPDEGGWVPMPQEPPTDTTRDLPPHTPVSGRGSGNEGTGSVGGTGEDSVGTIGGILLPEDTIPPDTVFIAVEIDPQIIPDLCPAPDFPELAQIAGLNGKVIVKVWVDRFGDIRKWKIIQASPTGFGFEDEVLKVIPNWKFTPAVQQSRAVGVWVAIPFKFVCKR